MPWWHENYIDPLNLYFHSTSIAKFVADLDPPREGYQPVQVVDLSYLDGRPMARADLSIQPPRQFAKAEQNRFEVQPDPELSLPGLNGLLQGRGHPDLRNPPTFVVGYPDDGEFIMHVGTVSAGGHLVVAIDGVAANEFDLPCGDGVGKSSVFRDQWKIWESVYDQDLSVPVRAGEHEISVDNTGQDWVQVTEFRFTGLLPPGSRELNVSGMAGRRTSIVWIQNPSSTWYNHAQGKVTPADPMRIVLGGLPDGPCDVEFWETWKGSISERRGLAVEAGKLSLDLPRVDSDIALKLRHTR
jgi:hypothetical protein